MLAILAAALLSQAPAADAPVAPKLEPAPVVANRVSADIASHLRSAQWKTTVALPLYLSGATGFAFGAFSMLSAQSGGAHADTSVALASMGVGAAFIVAGALLHISADSDLAAITDPATVAPAPPPQAPEHHNPQ